MTAPKGHRAGPWAKLIYVLIAVVSLVVIWAGMRSFETAPSADEEQLLPASAAGEKQ